MSHRSACSARIVLTAAGLLCAAAMAPAGAMAADTLGSNLTEAGDLTTCFSAGGGTCTIVQTALPGRTLTAPTQGVVTRWAVRDAAGTLKLKLVRDAPGGRLAVAASEPAAVPAGGAGTFPTRLPIEAGDRIALDVPESARIGMHFQEGAQAARYAELAATPTAPDYEDPTGYELLFQAVVEPDADRDGFGDETQDTCPADPAAQEGCAPATPPAGEPGADRPADESRPDRDDRPGGERPEREERPDAEDRSDTDRGAPATRISLRTRAARLERSRRIVVRVAAADAGARFAGRLVLLLPSGRRLGSAALRIGPGATRAVRVRVPARVARTLRRRRVQQVTVAVSRGGFLRSIGTLPVVA